MTVGELIEALDKLKPGLKVGLRLERGNVELTVKSGRREVALVSAPANVTPIFHTLSLVLCRDCKERGEVDNATED